MLVEKVARTIERYGMVCPGDRVLIGISGGPDSVALVHALLEFGRRESIELGLAHLNHQLREDAGSDEAFCRELARQMGLRFTSERVDVVGEARRHGNSIEEQARILRYRFLERTARKWGSARIAVGHTLDDQAETFLLRLFRGSGTTGLSAIRPVVDQRLIRPLLEVRRSEVLGFLHSRDLTYRLDPSNLDCTIPRNQVRHQTLPFLEKQHNPGLAPTLARTAALLRDEEDWMEEAAARAIREMSRTEADRLWLPVEGLRGAHPALRRRLVRQAISMTKGDLRGLTHRHVEDVLGLLASGKSGRRLCLPELDCGRSFGGIWFQPAAGPHREGQPWVGSGQMASRRYNEYDYALAVPGQLTIPEAGGAIKVEEPKPTPPPGAAAGASVLVALGDGCGSLRARSPRPGDRFRPLGAPGAKSVSRYLMERRVDRERRRQVPLVVSEGQGIVWVVGHGVSEASRVQAGAQRVLRLSWLVA
jgi:tRNA(Ile)-lysidine synthase